MGIRFYCPNGHKLHVKAFQAGMRGICPHCGTKVQIPYQSTRPSTKELKARRAAARQQLQQSPVTAEGAGPTVAPPDSSQLKEERQSGAPPTVFENLGEIILEGSTAQDGGAPESFRSAPTPIESLETRTARFSYAEVPLGHPGAEFLYLASKGDDPLADPDVVWYVRPPSGGQYGPAAPQVVRTWIAEGRITPDTLVWREGWRDWKLARNVFAYLGGAEFPHVSPQEQPEMRFVRASPSRPSTSPTVFLIISIVAAVALTAVATWFFFLR